ncbi:SDR family oxidoreductase [Gallaecimonas sp. GXIMD4217]|uniref:SDR family oxidoreductase n=1 Tax=Gallaecimonas sp. GXIMD4217 TaxID=3131927 RepID=UPI00311B1AA9
MNILITGANRGIGLALARHYSQQGHQVLACVRRPGDAVALAALDGVKVLALDVSQDDSIQNLQARLAQTPIQLLINNAGVYGPSPSNLHDLKRRDWQQVMDVNLYGPLLLTQALIDNLRQAGSARVAFISSKMGSIGDNGSGGCLIYRSSKAALNAAVRSLALDLAHEGILVGLYHPGWVQTAMGGPNALIDTATSIAGLAQRIEELSLGNSGQFLAYDGSPIPW